MQYATEMKLKLNLLCEFLETENYCYATVFKTTKVDLVTFYKCITAKFFVISSEIKLVTLYSPAIFWGAEGGLFQKANYKNYISLSNSIG